MTRTLECPVATKDLVVKAGATWQMGMRILDLDPAGGTSVLRDTSTLQSAVLKVRKTPADPTVVLELSTDNGRITTGIIGDAPYEMNMVLTLPGVITRAVTDFTDGVYDLRVILANGEPDYWLGGTFTLIPEVSW